ncbi:hypothetical protein GEV33_004116 [Tenebrio molitor]|uniref:Uncharacterized protein n=1 Tax=Tenebrio molitor TaxID=7067 RepID=A0A8J6HQ51_TENMO|nr:hypothetical protein GEV33_004116 [Tenebrio molitor]
MSNLSSLFQISDANSRTDLSEDKSKCLAKMLGLFVNSIMSSFDFSMSVRSAMMILQPLEAKFKAV